MQRTRQETPENSSFEPSEATALSDDQIKSINWFVEGMQGTLPKGTWGGAFPTKEAAGTSGDAGHGK
ncbi:hypothetical protein QCE73_37630 [Caballeronia sp. LZ029]|uniref:hypothetical protein n=1 Tax=Caballeronia sp. LZ029 TaxID=3038564 RepID=UPI002854ACF6|nr:hypothetical protein [Caballeronia sp. LZ029]MDR5748898.1 hypothetical protein [Caballeronia sp. LZ029]